MNDQHLEAVLRRSLAQQAATIDAGPQWPLPDEDLLVAAPRRSLPWWPIAAAVAAVLAVIGIVVAVRHVASDRHRPATPVRVTRTACATELPPAWHRAINAGTLPNSSGGDVVLGGPRTGPSSSATPTARWRRPCSSRPTAPRASSSKCRGEAGASPVPR